MPKKNRKPPVGIDDFVIIGIYGIWSKLDRKIIFISLDQEEVELEYDMEGYSDLTHAIVFLNAAYDASSLEP